MKVLVACEYSGVVRDAFTALGHDATSNDLLPSEAPGKHIVGDCIDVIASQRWDLIIMHPPCTALAVSGNAWYGTGMPKNAERVKAIEWTLNLWAWACAHADSVCMENPVGVLPVKPTQYVQPWMFGHTEQKKTGLWLHSLPKLVETDNVYEQMMLLPKRERERMHYLPPTPDRWKIRSTTYAGIAEAMATQWSK